MAIRKQISLNGLKNTIKDIKEVGKEANNSSQHIDKLTKSLTKLFSIEKITKAIVSGIKKAVDYTEDLNLLKVAFGETADAAYSLSKNIASITGFDEATLTRNLATFRNLTSTLGLANEQADLLSTNLEKMSIDISSLYNVDLDRAAYALQGMLTGQPRTIKTLTGANVTNAALQEELTSMNIGLKISELNKAEKAILQYLTVEKQLINANGDMARTLEQPAQLLRVFREQLEKAGRSIGTLFIPALRNILPYLNAILMVFNEIVGVFAKVFGIDTDSVWNDMKVGTAAVKTNIDGIAKSANKAKMGLRAFDKLNVINTPSSSGGGGGGGASNLGGINSKLLDALDEYDLKLDKVKSKATEIRDRIMEWLGFSKIINEKGELIGWKYEGIKKTLSNIYNSLKKTNGIVKILIGYGIYKLLKKLLSPLGKIIVYASDFVKLKLASVLQSIKKIGLEPTLDFLVKSMTPMERMAAALGGLVSMITGLLSLSSAFAKIKEEGLNASNAFEALLGMIELVAGAIIMVTAVTGTFKMEMALATGGITLAIGAIVGLTSYLGAAKESTEAVNESTVKYRQELKELEEQIANRMKETYAQASRAEDLKNKLTDLVDENGKVRGSHEKVEQILKELNSIMGTNYKLTGDQITLDGHLINKKEELSKSVDKYINKLKAEMLIESSREKIQKIYERNLELKGKENTLLEKLKESAQNYNLETKEGAEQFFKDNQGIIGQLQGIQSELITNNNQLDLYAQAAIKAEKGQFEEAEKLITSTAEKAKVSITDIYGQLGKVFDQKITTQIEAQLTIDSKKFDKELQKYQKQAEKGLLNVQVYSNSTKKQLYAEGGFPESGQIFMARENGMAEYVGQMGHKTAVANNDQIVEGISKGVANAIISTGGMNSRPIVIKADGDANGLMNFIKFKQQEENMQYGN